jgi:uncharacterized lipoprotein YehR (DUF1307 family)
MSKEVAMRFCVACLFAVFMSVLFMGCAEQEEKDRVTVKAPGVEVREKQDGSVRVKAPFVDIKTDH